MLVSMAGAQAHTFCVATPTELQQALDAVSDNGAYVGESNVIQIVHGTYLTGAPTSNGPFFSYAPNATHLLTVSGGYGGGCGSQGNFTAADTILDGHNATAVLALRRPNANTVVSNLTVQNGNGDQPGAGLQVNYLVTVNAQVTVHHVLVRDNHSSVTVGGLYVSGAGPAGTAAYYIENVLIADNSSDVDYGGAYLTGFGAGAGVVANVTVTRNNTAAGGTGGLFCGGTSTCNIFDSIAWNNTNIGIWLDNAGALVCDDYGTLGGTPPGFSNNNLSLAPQFVDAAGGDFHLSSNSPLFGRCPGGNGILDLDNHPYPGSGKGDMGAYEETVFADGFDD
jgi:hypothetical protein